MKKKLESLTVDQFIELLCGNPEGLESENDFEALSKNSVIIRNIILEYRAITDPSGARRQLREMERVAKARLEVTLYTIVSNMIELKGHSRVREILIWAERMDDARLEAEVQSRLARARRKVEESGQAGKDEPSSDEIRRRFDEQTSALMAYFKFQIDTSTMKASLYAHLVARQGREIKARLAAMKK